MRIFHSLAELEAVVGQEVAVGDWITIDQQRIDRFADATNDHQWIHVDPVRAKAGPFGGPIVHGFLTLSLLPHLTWQAMSFPGTTLTINYGLNKVRFPAPVPVDSRLRARFRLLSVEPLPPQGGQGGAQIVWETTIECEGGRKPVCVAETVSRQYGA